jgi:hypothetical protein
LNSRPLILPANVLLLFVGVMDLVTTLWWLHTGCAVEYNPIMAALLRLGTPIFVAVKLASLIACVGVLEWYRRKRCALFAKAAGLFAVVAYTSIYVVSFLVVNRDCILG